jgi:EAL domain-containing protein (putative c-di-GMP-specific phosphodiesterase class I)/GGDEF domain-containing protein
MSLIKQLWLAILFILILASGGSFLLSTIFSKNYLQQQLQMKNIDNATSLALSMSQMEKDPITLDLLLSAQFDSGHYRYIGLYDPVGKVMSERINELSHTKAPNWFVKLVPMTVEIGIAEVQDGWARYGTLKLESDSSFVYDRLWDATVSIAIWALLIGLITCYAGSHMLRKILSPLKDVVNQAQAIGEHRFVTIEEPKTHEFKALVNAMNSLSNHIRKTVSEESARLEELRLETNFDHISGLKNHDYFISIVDSGISHEELFNQGVFVVARLTNLGAIDQSLGYQETNAFLKRIGDLLKNECANQASLFVGRLSGTDFAVFSSAPVDAYVLGTQIKSLLEKASTTILPNANFVTVSTLVKKADKALKLKELTGSVLDEISAKNKDMLHVINHVDIESRTDINRDEWQRLLINAIDNKQLKLEHYPVATPQGDLMHHECCVRLQLETDGRWLSAGEFIVWAHELNLMNRIDALVLETAIKLLTQGAEPIGLNLSASAICDKRFTQEAIAMIKPHKNLADRLYFDIPEQAAFDNFVEFKSFCSQLKELGCNVGIEHVGSRISSLGELHDVGLNYIKVDVSVIRDIDANEANKTLLRGLCIIAHSMGVVAIAEGVRTANEIEALKLIGIDGMTGPGIKITKS